MNNKRCLMNFNDLMITKIYKEKLNVAYFLRASSQANRGFRLAFQFLFTDEIESIEYETDLHAVMYGLKEDLSITGIQIFSIDRQALWQDSIVAFKNPKFNPAHQQKVRFLGEAGI